MIRLALLSALLSTATAAAYELKRDSSGEPIRWSAEATFVVSEELSAQLAEPGAFEALSAAAEELRRAAGGLRLSLRQGQADAPGFDFGEDPRNQSSIVALAEWPYDPNAIAVTIVTVDSRSHRVLDADIAFNTASRRFQVLPDSAQWDGRGLHDDIQNTATHELGHALGLAHNPDEPRAVMYPAARRGETSKRTLFTDDAAALAFLYGEGGTAAPERADAAGDEPAQGCSASGGGAGLLPLAAAALALLRRRRAAVTAVLLLASPALASEDRPPAPVAGSLQTARALVTARRTLPPAPGQRVLQTELRVLTVECLEGSCPDEWVLVVPGGRLGHLEQTVDGLQVPEPGERIAFTVAPGAPTRAPAPARVRLYRLSQAPDALAFLRGLAHSDAVRGSPRTQR